MAPRHRCPRPSQSLDHPLTGELSSALDFPIEYLGPDGPLHPDVRPLRTVDDAFDAIDLSRPGAFRDGLVVLLLDPSACPMLAMAVDHAPDDDIDAIAALLADVRDRGHPIAGVVLGVYRPARTVGSAAIKMTIDGLQLAAWMSLSRLLNGSGITLVDVLVFEPGRWMSLVAATSSEIYPTGPLPWPAALR